MLKIIIWDVQHGSATYLRTPKGQDIAIDLGTGSYKEGDHIFSPFFHLKHKWNVSYLDAVIVTHPHLDHISDILNFDILSPRALCRPRHLTDSAIWAGNPPADRRTRETVEKYLEVNEFYVHPISADSDPLDENNNGGVNIKIFTPHNSSTSNLNNHSIVVVVSYAGLKIILPGDNESPSWDELLANSAFVSAISGADILVAPHHGRERGFHSELFRHFRPRLTVISDGRFSDTSATSRYAAVTQGWTIHRRNGIDIERKCVTTRNDGVIEIGLGMNPNGGNNFIDVKID